MTFKDQLEKLNACNQSLEWIKDKTIEEAWKTCKNPNWMLWILTKTDLNLADPICDMAERVLYLVPEDIQLACIWALSAIKRRANIDELDAAFYAANVAAFTARGTAALAAAAASYAAYAYATNTAYYYTDSALASANAANYYADADADADAAFTDYRKEEKNQCDILREYFTLEQVKEAFNKLVA